MRLKWPNPVVEWTEYTVYKATNIPERKNEYVKGTKAKRPSMLGVLGDQVSYETSTLQEINDQVIYKYLPNPSAQAGYDTRWIF